MGKATNFKFCTHIHKIDRNKSPLKISAKVVVGVPRDSRKFSGHPSGVRRGGPWGPWPPVMAAPKMLEGQERNVRSEASG